VANSSPEAVFRARGLRKTYRTGDVEMQALRDVDELAQVEAALRRLDAAAYGDCVDSCIGKDGRDAGVRH